MADTDYTTALSEHVDKSIRKWAKQKKDSGLEQKLATNLEAVTNQDYRRKLWKKEEGQGWRSTTWVGYIRVKVWAFYSVLLDTVMRAGKVPFDLTPTAYEEYEDPQMIEDRDERIDRMKKKIESQQEKRKSDREYMKKWLSAGYYGMAFSKFNIETISWSEFKPVDMGLGDADQYLSPEETQQYRRFELETVNEDVPGHRYVSVWNMVWDMESEGLQNKDSEGYAEAIKSCAYDLRQLDGQPGYITEAIKRVIEKAKDGVKSDKEIASKPGTERLRDLKKTINRFEYYMRAPRILVEEFESSLKSKGHDPMSLNLIADYEDADQSGDDVEIMGEIADAEIIRHIRNETGKRPHHKYVLEMDLDDSTGRGIADNMEGIQASLVGMIRSFEDNKKLSANVTAAVKERFFDNPAELDDIVPGKKYNIADSCDDVRKAIMPIVYADVGESLMSGISLMMQIKDDVSMIPTILQGFTLPKQKPDTLGEMQMLTQNAGKYMGQAIRNNDEFFIEPEITDIYEYNMLYDEDESIKCSCRVNANGFTSFQNKEVRGARMQQVLSLVMASEYLLTEVKIKPHLDILYEAMDEDPDKYLLSEEEKQERSEAQAEAEQEALEQAKQQLEVEAQVKAEADAQVQAQKIDGEMKVAEQKHAHNMAEADQEHVHNLELEALKGQLEEKKAEKEDKNKESQGGSEK